jgi:hypothetical protein
MDATVVLLGWLDVALTGDAYMFLRIVRVLRPLRTITHIKGLKVRHGVQEQTGRHDVAWWLVLQCTSCHVQRSWQL